MGDAASSHNPHGNLGLIVEQAIISTRWGKHVVYICTSVLMNYECMTPIATKFLSKHCIKRVLETLDTEMSRYHCFNFTGKTFLRSVDPKQPSHFHFVPSLKLSQGAVFQERCKILRGGAKRSQGRCAPLHTSPQNPVLMQINHHS
jgi:hypothetical protein